MADQNPTPTQGKYLSYINAFIEGFGYGPTMQETADALQVSTPSVNQMFKTLEKKRFIRRQSGVSRSIEILLDTDLIPRWGKAISTTRWEWVREEPNSNTTTEADDPPIYRYKITLLETSPPIWRMIETKNVSLTEFHELIQTAMGWTNSHLHAFEIKKTRYCDPRMFEFGGQGPNEHSYEGICLTDLVNDYGDQFILQYEYDFGDGWLHRIELLEIKASESRVRYPRCVDGAMACPPEDIGGVWGYADFVEAINNPQHPEHEHYFEWNGPFDPDKFNTKQATRRMRNGIPTW